MVTRRVSCATEPGLQAQAHDQAAQISSGKITMNAAASNGAAIMVGTPAQPQPAAADSRIHRSNSAGMPDVEHR